jgi:HEPN pEK499 p136
MANYDLRLDVPARAYINAQLLSLLETGGTFFDAKKHLFSLEPLVTQGLTPYNWKIHDHTLVISLLYCTIVVPREILDLPKDHQIYRDFDAQKVAELFSLVNPKDLNSYQLVRHLRNAVAHALFSIQEHDGHISFKFWSDRDSFQAEIDQQSLLRLIGIVGQRFTNAVLSRK